MNRNKMKPHFNEAERDFPISEDELDYAYQHTRDKVSKEDKKKTIDGLLELQPLLAPICKNAYNDTSAAADTIPDMILTAVAVYTADTDLLEYNRMLCRALQPLAKELASAYLEDEDGFYGEMESAYEPNLFVFFGKKIGCLNLPPKEFKRNLSVLFTWAFMIEEARKEQHPEKYETFDDGEAEDEQYDFDHQKPLRLFHLHVKLRGFRVSVDLNVPEDATFDQLHTVLNSIFRRDDDHLYRFECDDGCIAVRDKEELEDGSAVLAGKCFLGHHLERGSKVYYLFDYGDEWEHDITVKKVISAEPKNCHFELLKITGEIPDQYSDED